MRLISLCFLSIIMTSCTIPAMIKDILPFALDGAIKIEEEIEGEIKKVEAQTTVTSTFIPAPTGPSAAKQQQK